MAEAAIFFCKNGGISHAFYFKASFHTDEILNESRRHLEFWPNDVLGHTIYFLLEYCTFVILFWRNTSIQGEVIAVLPNPRWRHLVFAE